MNEAEYVAQVERLTKGLELARAERNALRREADESLGVIERLTKERDEARCEEAKLLFRVAEIAAERDEARAEVERLKKVVADATESVRLREEETLDHARERDEAKRKEAEMWLKFGAEAAEVERLRSEARRTRSIMLDTLAILDSAEEPTCERAASVLRGHGHECVAADPKPTPQRLFGRNLDLPSGVLATAESPKPAPPVDVPNLPKRPALRADASDTKPGTKKP